MKRGVAVTNDWQADIVTRLHIAPTTSAMQRHLLFTLRCSAVESFSPTPGDFRIVVNRDDESWEGAGASQAEAMGRALLAATTSEDA